MLSRLADDSKWERVDAVGIEGVSRTCFLHLLIDYKAKELPLVFTLLPDRNCLLLLKNYTKLHAILTINQLLLFYPHEHSPFS